MPRPWVSLGPCRIVVAVEKDGHTHGLSGSGSAFPLKFLDEGQEDLVREFTGPLDDDTGTVSGSHSTTGGAAIIPSSTRSSPTSNAES